jgi:hypothetical protein
MTIPGQPAKPNWCTFATKDIRRDNSSRIPGRRDQSRRWQTLRFVRAPQNKGASLFHYRVAFSRPELRFRPWNGPQPELRPTTLQRKASGSGMRPQNKSHWIRSCKDQPWPVIVCAFSGESSSVGRASDCGSDGRGFEPRLSPHLLWGKPMPTASVRRLRPPAFQTPRARSDSNHSRWGAPA